MVRGNDDFGVFRSLLYGLSFPDGAADDDAGDRRCHRAFFQLRLQVRLSPLRVGPLDLIDLFLGSPGIPDLYIQLVILALDCRDLGLQITVVQDVEGITLLHRLSHLAAALCYDRLNLRIDRCCAAVLDFPIQGQLSGHVGSSDCISLIFNLRLTVHIAVSPDASQGGTAGQDRDQDDAQYFFHLLCLSFSCFLSAVPDSPC